MALHRAPLQPNHILAMAMASVSLHLEKKEEDAIEDVLQGAIAEAAEALSIAQEAKRLPELHRSIYKCTHVHMYTCASVHMCTCTHVHMCTCTHVHMYTCTHIHTCTCAHVCTHVRGRKFELLGSVQFWQTLAGSGEGAPHCGDCTASLADDGQRS